MCVPKKKEKDEASAASTASSTARAAQLSPKVVQSRSAVESGKKTPEALETVEDKTQKECEDEERLQAVYDALGVKRRALGRKMAKILKEQKKLQKNPLPASSEGSQKLGDIQYSFKKAGKKSSEDTVYEKKQKKYSYGKGSKGLQKYGASAETVEEVEPNETNFMWNPKDMHYVAHEMMYVCNQSMVPSAPMEKKKHDPFGPLDLLEKDPIFNWDPFKVNTLLSNALTLPNEAELVKKPVKPAKRRIVKWKDPVAINLTRHESKENTAEDTAKEYNVSVMKNASVMKTAERDDD